MPSMTETLNLVPNLRSLILIGEADDCTEKCELYIPLPPVLSSHPLLHWFECDGSVDLCIGDILAIASHPGLVHIRIFGYLHCQYLADVGDYVESRQVDFEFDSDKDLSTINETQESYVLCGSCSAKSVTARLSLMRHLQHELSKLFVMNNMEVPAPIVEAVQNLIKRLELEDEQQKSNEGNHSLEHQTRKRKVIE